MIEILRLSHRLPRDARITTHVALTARAFGATAMHYSGMHDQEMEDAVVKVAENFGGPFSVTHITNERAFLNQKKKDGYTLIHLTAYGMPFQTYTKRTENRLIIVGGEKVPSWIYTLADYNLSVGNQPHSEVSALGIFLYSINGTQETFTRAKRKIIGTSKGKHVETLNDERNS